MAFTETCIRFIHTLKHTLALIGLEIIKNQKERAMEPLMGIVMKELRGKASGEIINKLLLNSKALKLD